MRFPDDVPTLTSGDVTLRAHRLEDLAALVEQCTDPVSVRWTSVPLGYTPEMGRSYLTESVPRGWQDDTEWNFAIESTQADGRRRFSGSISLRNEGSRRAEIAYGAHPAARGRGAMTAAVRLLLDWGFGERDLETVSWLAERGNFGSRRVAWRAGFRFGGVVPRWLNHRDLYPDAWIGALHRDDPREPQTTWYDVPTLTGETIGLRPQREADADRIVEGCNDEATAYWLTNLPAPFTRVDAVEYVMRGFEAASEGLFLQWAVADIDTDEFLGVVGLPRIKRGSAEVGYWTHPDARGRGVMTEAVRVLVRHAFSAADAGGLGLRRLFIKVAADNVASQRVGVANGFTYYGSERRSEVLRDGRPSDMALYDLLAEEWKG
jgi:RimJ/RimL family protein N-acetyltransferase